MKSLVYTSDRYIETTDDTYHGKLFFQKDISLFDDKHKVELYVAEKLLKTPLENIVKVYEIIYEPYISIKYELLDMDRKIPEFEYIKSNIVSGLNSLHSINCVYIDIKEDNMGYCINDKCWKLFDFDCSGITTPDFNKWVLKPPDYFMMRNIRDFEKNIKKYVSINKISEKKKMISKIKKIKKSENLMKYDVLATYIYFGKLIE